MSDAALLREACALLGVDRRASVEQVRAAWKRKLKQVHPDVGGSKEAVQHATNMRDILLAWIDAGRPDLEAQPDPVSTAYTPTRSAAQDFAWARPAQHQPAYSWRKCMAIVAIWAIVLLLNVLSVKAPPRNAYRPIELHQSQFATGRDSLPICAGMDIYAETKAMIEGKCWPRR